MREQKLREKEIDRGREWEKRVGVEGREGERNRERLIREIDRERDGESEREK